MASNDYPTIPNPALRPPQRRNQQALPVTAPQKRRTPQRPLAPRGRPEKTRFSLWLLLVPVALLGLFLVTLLVVVLGLKLVFSSQILPGVHVADVALGGLSQVEAAQVLSRNWDTLTLRDNEHTWNINPATLGLMLDANRSAAAAFAQGHGEGGLRALLGRVDVAPVLIVDTATVREELTRIARNFAIAPVNAGVEFVNGQVRATEAEQGRSLDIEATVLALQNGVAFNDAGEVTLIMRDITPAVSDSTPVVAQAQALLANPLDIRVFDPVTGDSMFWSLLPQEWAQWITAAPDANSPIGLTLDANPAAIRAYLRQQVDAAFDDSRSLDFDAAVQSIRSALAAGQPDDAFVTVQHGNRRHIVQPGETLSSIGYDYGIPYLYIQEANSHIASVSPGQEIIIPPADSFLLTEIVPNKRIVVDISEQRTRVYENGALKWDWPSSTGINSSPTWTGIYQILTHVPSAYAGIWDLNMPNFMGVYQPVPGSDFMNGFHGIPTRGGGQVVWENSVGTPVTFGCILLSDANSQRLYNWAEEGVVVEIRA